jgi:hypothetical protein
MRLFGFEVSVRKQLPTVPSNYLYDRGWYPVVREPFAGAWQQNRPVSLRHHAGS